jgi:hypothetical protein
MSRLYAVLEKNRAQKGGKENGFIYRKRKDEDEDEATFISFLVVARVDANQ